MTRLQLIVDVDGTLTYDDGAVAYCNKMPRRDVIARVNALHAQGVQVLIWTARNMRTYEGNIGKINKFTLPILIEWLAKHDVQYDEVHVGKPWCGTEGFYVQANSLRPSSFLALPMTDLEAMLGLLANKTEVKEQ